MKGRTPVPIIGNQAVLRLDSAGRKKPAADAYHQSAQAAYEALAAAYATAEARWMQAVLPATQAYLAALASDLAAWSAAAAQAATARDDRIQAAERTYAQRLQDLQSQADQAWQHYESALFDAGCVPQGGPATFLVQYRDPRNFGIGIGGGGYGSGTHLEAPMLRPGRLGGIAHRTTVQQRAAQLQREGYKIVAGGGQKPEQAVEAPGGKRRFPDIIAERPDGSRHYENVGRARRDGMPIKREQDALKDIEAATGVVPHFTPYNPERIIGPLP